MLFLCIVMNAIDIMFFYCAVTIFYTAEEAKKKKVV